MVDARRPQLPKPQALSDGNPGLLLHHYLAAVGDKSVSARDLHGIVQKIPAGPAYKEAFTRWQAAHAARASTLTTETLTAPLAVGLGSASPTDVGLTTSRPYGMPVIPGSALKGVCKTGAKRLMAEGLMDGTAVEALFGTQESASYFVFWDAWYDPESVDGRPFHPDTITVHHSDYYGTRGVGGPSGVWPTDFDDPNPVPFLVVRPGARFLFTLDAPTPQWGKFALSLLRWSLANVGVGSKTNAGYGYFAAAAPPGQNGQGQAQGASTAGGPVVVEWTGVTVIYTPGKNSLLETAHGSEKARVDGQPARDLIAALPEDAAAKLKGNRKQLDGATVRVEADGNSRAIAGISVPPS